MSDDAPVVFDKYRGEVEFKFLKNAVFRFRQKDLSSLSSRFGPEYLKKFEAAMENHDAAALEVFILAGLKEKGGGKYPIDDETIDDPPWPTTAPYGPMRAAMMFAITGLTAAEAEKAEAEARERMRQEVEEKFPLGPSAGQEPSSTEFDGKASATA